MQYLNVIQNASVSQEEIKKAVIGGCLISLSSSLNLLLTGRITGMSGICFKAVTAPSESFYRWCNILGLIFAASAYTYLFGLSDHDTPQQFLGDISLPLFLIAGFMVGFGTKLGNGCTSGHGVCGLPRLSIRSYVAVFTFLPCGIIAATLRSQYSFANKGDFVEVAVKLQNKDVIFGTMLITGFLIIAMLFYQLFQRESVDKTKDWFVSVLVGAIFSLGLIISGMVKKSKIIGFLVLDNNWDPSLIFVLLSAVGLNFITFSLILKNVSVPWVVNLKLDVPTNNVIDFKLIFGATVFGVGWGLSGLCPGPVLVNIFLYLPHLGLFFSTLVFGQVTADKFVSTLDKLKEKFN